MKEFFVIGASLKDAGRLTSAASRLGAEMIPGLLASLAPMLARIEANERRQIADQAKNDANQTKNEERFKLILDTMQDKMFPPQKVFYDGQVYDAKAFATKYILSAKSSILLIDNWVDVVTLDMLTKKKRGVEGPRQEMLRLHQTRHRRNRQIEGKDGKRRWNRGKNDIIRRKNMTSAEKETTLKDLEANLWETADSLRNESSLTSQMYYMPVLGVIFLQHATYRFRMVEKALAKARDEIVAEREWLVSKFGKTGKYKDVPGLCKSATRAEIAEKKFSLNSGAYVGVAAQKDDGVDFTSRMKEIHAELLARQNELGKIMKSIDGNLKELGL